jgi:hypothetical protein
MKRLKGSATYKRVRDFMSEHKIIRLKWLEDLEGEINKRLKERFPKKDFSISKLSLQYDIIQPLDMSQGKKLVLTGPIGATYDLNFTLSTEEGKQALNLVGEKLSERIRARGIW